MRLFLVAQVGRLMRKDRMPDSSLCRSAAELVAGRLGAGEADLGGGLFKKRIARAGGGKRGGYRAITAYRQPRTDRVLFAFAFAKNAASTLTPQGQEALRIVAGAFTTASDHQVEALRSNGDVIEVDCDETESA